MIDYIISGILVIFIITVLVYLRRRGADRPARAVHRARRISPAS